MDARTLTLISSVISALLKTLPFFINLTKGGKKMKKKEIIINLNANLKMEEFCKELDRITEKINKLESSLSQTIKELLQLMNTIT